MSELVNGAGGQGRNLPTCRTDRSVPDRATRVASWVGWHLPELAGVTVPAVTAVTVSPWAWLVSGVVGAGWTVHACRTGREQAAPKASRGTAAVTASGVDSAQDGPAPDADVVDADVVADSGEGGAVRRNGGVA